MGGQISHYEVLDRLGSGGMGEVFLARDLRLDRKVALKLLPPALGLDDQARSRLLGEARAASRLDHPNVCAVFEVDESNDGSLFIAMAFCAGRTLSEIVAEGPLDPHEAVRIASEIAEGLSAAHDAGVAHHDVKPGNVIVAPDGRVKIVDFGLAQLQDNERTRRAEIAGTTAYMAPEQFLGQPAGDRADVWSLGVVLQEMLTGRRPFEAPYQEAVMYRIVHGDPEPLEIDLPDDLQHLPDVIQACLTRDPERRPPMDDVAIWVREPSKTAEDASATPNVWSRASFSTRRRWLVAAGALTSCLAIVAILFQLATPSLPAERFVVLLPFSTLGDTDEDRALADGLTITLTNKLVQLAGYTDQSYWVVPQSEVRRREIASPSMARRAFGATLVLEGNLIRLSPGLQLTMSVIDARTLRTLRAVDVAVEDDDFGRLHAEAVVRLADMIRVEVGPASAAALRAGGTQDPEAFELYVRAQPLLARHERKENVEAAVDLLQQALAMDPRFGLALAALGEAKWRLYGHSRDEVHVTPALRYLEQALAVDHLLSEARISLAMVYAGTDREDLARAALATVIRDEPNNADAYIILGRIESQAGHPALAEEAFRRAIELRPAYWEGHNALGVFLYGQARYEEALEAWHRVAALTPDNARAHANLGAAYYQLQALEDAARHFERSIELHPSYAGYVNLGTLYFDLEDMQRAARSFRSALELEPTVYRGWGYLGAAYRELNELEEMRRALHEGVRLAQRQLQINPADQRARVEMAGMLLDLGEYDRAADVLNAIDERSVDDVEVALLAAESFTRLDDRRRALEWLCHTMARGYPLENLERSAALEPLVSDPAYDEAVACAP